MRDFINKLWDQVFGSPGKRVYAAILAVAFVHCVVHLSIGFWLIRESLAQGSPFLALMIAITILTALTGALHLAQFLVFIGVLLMHGPGHFVAPPPDVPENQLPTVIVQIPGRNEASDEVVRSIDSVLALNYPPDKIRVQHSDNSDDDRWKTITEIYRQEPRVEVIHRDGTQGFKAGNLNFGTDHLRLQGLGDPRNILIGILDVGDMFAPASVRFMATEFLCDARLAFVQSMTRVANPHDTVITKAESHLAEASWRFYGGMRNTYGMPSLDGHHVLIRLEALLEVHKWDQTKISEDWATGINMLLKGWHGKWVDYAPTDASIVSAEVSPPTLEAQQKQKSRWATGGAELVKEHLPGCLRFSLPWNQRIDLCIRLLFYPTLLPRHIGMLLAPMWIGVAALTQGLSGTTFFGLFSASMQNALLWFVLAESVTYIREGAVRRAFMLVGLFPVQTVYNLPIIPHIVHGVLKGFRYALNAFIITPKKVERMSLAEVIFNQKLALLMATWMMIAAMLIFSLRPTGYVRVVAPLLVFAILTVFGVFLVPVSERLRRLLYPRR